MELIYSAAQMNRPRKLPQCMGNAGRVAGEHAWTWWAHIGAKSASDADARARSCSSSGAIKTGGVE